MLTERQGWKLLCLLCISSQLCEKGPERVGNLLQVTEEINSKSGSEVKVPDIFLKQHSSPVTAVTHCHRAVVMGVCVCVRVCVCVKEWGG